MFRKSWMPRNRDTPGSGAAEVAKIQAGVVSKEGSGTLNIRGGRGGEVTYYVDGVKSGYGVPQGAVAAAGDVDWQH